MVSIAFGSVMHRRSKPVRHAFSYPVFYLRVPLSQVGSPRLRWLSWDRFNLFSIHRRDFGPRDGSDLLAWMRAVLGRHRLAQVDGEIVIHAMPRMLGYAFNPIVTWHCHDRAGALRAVLCEVRNTFGERHHYLLSHADARPIGPRDWLRAEKAFHVSPFCEVEGHYRFRFGCDHGVTHLRIDYFDDDGRVLVTAMRGQDAPLTDALLLRTFAGFPFMTLAVMARIHLQALRLWLRHVPWFPKPPAPRGDLSS